jgi:hypothetical protein
MTKKEMMKMRALEIENQELKARIEKHMNVYRENLTDILDMKVKLQLIKEVMSGEYDD